MTGEAGEKQQEDIARVLRALPGVAWRCPRPLHGGGRALAPHSALHVGVYDARGRGWCPTPTGYPGGGTTLLPPSAFIAPASHPSCSHAGCTARQAHWIRSLWSRMGCDGPPGRPPGGPQEAAKCLPFPGLVEEGLPGAQDALFLQARECPFRPGHPAAATPRLLPRNLCHHGTAAERPAQNHRLTPAPVSRSHQSISLSNSKRSEIFEFSTYFAS